jgi:hypothetical protein
VIHAKAFHKRYQKSKVDKHLLISCTCCQLSNIICGLLGALLGDRLGDKPVFKGEGTSCPGFDLGHGGLRASFGPNWQQAAMKYQRPQKKGKKNKHMNPFLSETLSSSLLLHLNSLSKIPLYLLLFLLEPSSIYCVSELLLIRECEKQPGPYMLFTNSIQFQQQMKNHKYRCSNLRKLS